MCITGNYLQDFNADPMNPNLDGLLENVKQSYKAVIDQYGNEYLFLLLHHEIVYKLYRERGSCEVILLLDVLQRALDLNHHAFQ